MFTACGEKGFQRISGRMNTARRASTRGNCKATLLLFFCPRWMLDPIGLNGHDVRRVAQLSSARRGRGTAARSTPIVLEAV
jgi:hypothetical protein